MQHAQEFARRGLLFPKTGWYGVVPGHHAVAWELAANNGGPLLATLLEEIRAADSQSVVLSAEDFSLLYSRPQALSTLCDGLRSIGYTPKILMYLRAQGPFAESMYVERIKHDDIQPLERFISEVVETGRYTGSPLPLEFRYSRMLKPFSETFGRENIQVHTYEGRRDITRVFNDFVQTISVLTGAFEGQPVSFEISHPIVNESLSFIFLLGHLFSRTHPAENVAATARIFAAEFAPDLPPEYIDQRFALLRREDYLAILHSVVEDNQEILREYGARIPFLSDQDIPGPSNAIWAKAHIERKIFDRCLSEWLKEQSDANGG